LKNSSFLIVMLLLLSISVVNAEDVIWDNSFDYHSGADEPSALYVDSNGNSYITGAGVNDSHFDIVTIKYDSNGTLLWNNSFDYYSNNDRGNSIAVDSLGNSYVTGYGKTSEHTYYLITLKYASNGTLLWNRSFDYGLEDNMGNSIAVDSQGNSYVTGYGYNGSGCDILTLKYASNGTLLWNRSFDYVSDSDEGKGIAVDSDRNVYVAGYSKNGSITGITLLKYNESGNLLWNRFFEHDVDTYSIYFKLSSSGNPYLVGSKNTGPSSDVLILKYNESGNLQWNTTYEYVETSFAVARSFILDNDGNAYITGYMNSATTAEDIVIIKCASNGTLLWNNTFDLDSNLERGYSIAVDHDGNTYVAGEHSTEGGIHNLLILKYANNGALLWNNSIDCHMNTDPTLFFIKLDGYGIPYIVSTEMDGSNKDIIILKHNQTMAESLDDDEETPDDGLIHLSQDDFTEEGGFIINEPGYYVLDENITCELFGIIINSSNVLVDGRGFYLNRTDLEDESSGICTLNETFENITIKNFGISNFTFGISIPCSNFDDESMPNGSVSDLEITNCTFEFNLAGILVLNSENLIIESCNFTNNTFGIGVGYVTSGDISECNFESNMLGIESVINENVTIDSCNFINHTVGIVSLNVTGEIISSCDVVNNTFGIVPVNCTYGTISGCNFEFNEYGISTVDIFGEGPFGEISTYDIIQNYTILRNNFVNNTYALHLFGKNNEIYRNNFENNGENVNFEAVISNYFHSPVVTYEYNGETYTGRLGNYFGEELGTSYAGIFDRPYGISIELRLER